MICRRRLQGLLTWIALAASARAQADEQDVTTPRLLQLRPLLGVGAHSRSFTRPTDTGTQTLKTAYVPAIELGLSVLVWPSADFSLAFAVSYQTGLWLTVSELPQFAHGNEVSVRSQRLALNVAPSWRIGAQTRLGLALGGTLRSFTPEDHALQTPSYSLVGPHVRGEFVTALVGPLCLRVSPELQWVVAIDQSAAASSRTAVHGAAIGAELALELPWGPTRTLALNYRESHALLARGARFKDVERYLTVRIEEAF